MIKGGFSGPEKPTLPNTWKFQRWVFRCSECLGYSEMILGQVLVHPHPPHRVCYRVYDTLPDKKTRNATSVIAFPQ